MVQGYIIHEMRREGNEWQRFGRKLIQKFRKMFSNTFLKTLQMVKKENEEMEKNEEKMLPKNPTTEDRIENEGRKV